VLKTSDNKFYVIAAFFGLIAFLSLVGEALLSGFVPFDLRVYTAIILIAIIESVLSRKWLAIITVIEAVLPLLSSWWILFIWVIVIAVLAFFLQRLFKRLAAGPTGEKILAFMANLSLDH
jgi:hypothetical protein